MQRVPWTLMQWSALECKFVPKSATGAIEIFNGRKRIPHIDKLLARSVDPRLREFVTAVQAHDLDTASVICENFSESIDISTLSECSLLLKSSSAPIGENTKSRLQKYSIWDWGTATLTETDPPNPHLNAAVWGPLNVLKDNNDLSNYELQHLLDNSSLSLSSELLDLKTNWLHDMMDSKLVVQECLNMFETVLTKGNSNLVCAALSIKEQVVVTAEFMARFTASSVSSTFPQSLAHVCKRLGNLIESTLLSSVSKRYLPFKSITPQSELVWSFLNQPPWNQKQKLILGAFWINVALRNCRFNTVYNGRSLSRPAFWQTWYMSGSSKKGIIITNQGLIQQLKERKNSDSIFITSDQIPSLTPPHPWVSVKPLSVGLYNRGLRLVTSQSTEGQSTVSESIKSAASLPHISALNRLQSQSWRINQEVLSILKTIRPPNPLADSPLSKTTTAQALLLRDKRHQREQARIERACKTAITQWNQAIAIAESLGDRTFYLPMYMDFRGRCYAMANSSLSFMGNDYFRSLFLFSEGKELGNDGLMWLKIHLANLYGSCKLSSFSERVQWADAHLEKICKSGLSPLNNDWWQKGSKPYQVLAACMELAKAYEHPHGPSKYKSRLPVQLDGTSNGLQHLVALSRDEKNAAEVNVTGQVRGDVYSVVAKQLSENEKAKRLLPESMDRSAVKKAIMIYFYGGSQNTMAESLEQCGFKKPNQIASILATILNTKFKRERAVQQWLSHCAQLIMTSSRADHVAIQGSSKADKSEAIEENDDETQVTETESRGNSKKTHAKVVPGKPVYCSPTVVWTSPLGLPVVQPYVQTKFMAIRTPLQAFFWTSPFHVQICEKSKQVAGIAANFVHSLDAAHMLATARSMPATCSFSAVHDSFWTHASTVTILNQVLRREFVALHDTNILENVWHEWKTRYNGFMTQATIYSDSPVYSVVKALRAERLTPGPSGGISDSAVSATAKRAKSKTANQKEQEEAAFLEMELKKWAVSGIPLPLKKCLEQHPMTWESAGPTSGTKGKRLASLKVWVPLELPPPPMRGDLDITEVTNSTYFFN